MFGFGGDLLFILFLAMLIFGPEKLPEIGRMVAKGMAEVRKASNELKRTLNAELAVSEQEIAARRLAALPAPAAAALAVPASDLASQTVPASDSAAQTVPASDFAARVPAAELVAPLTAPDPDEPRAPEPTPGAA